MPVASCFLLFPCFFLLQGVRLKMPVGLLHIAFFVPLLLFFQDVRLKMPVALLRLAFFFLPCFFFSKGCVSKFFKGCVSKCLWNCCVLLFFLPCFFFSKGCVSKFLLRCYVLFFICYLAFFRSRGTSQNACGIVASFFFSLSPLLLFFSNGCVSKCLLCFPFFLQGVRLKLPV